MSVNASSSARVRIDDLIEQLHPDSARERVLRDLDDLFTGGRAPEPPPGGFLPGRLLTTAISQVPDAGVRRVARLWMPWLGKAFDASTSTGVNVLRPTARGPLRMLWPSYEPEAERPDAIDVFPFNTRVAPGEVDPELDVLKIDYDHDRNPGFVIRNILDELVQVDEGLYLGKILYRRRGSYQPIGFFTLGKA